MGDTERTVMAAILALLWLAVVIINSLYLGGHVLDRSLDGPSPLPIVGSVFGVLALAVVPFETIGLRMLALPIALLPDLMTFGVFKWISWVNERDR